MSTGRPSTVPERLLRAEDLPSIPAVALEVLRLCRDESTTLEELAAALSCDPALSARLLRFANSSLYNLGGEVSSLQRAAIVLGMKTVQLMALSFSLASSLPRESQHNLFDYERFWRRSIVRAVASRTLSSLARTLTEDEAFLCGLLAEFGQLVLAQSLNEEYDRVLERAGTGPSRTELEREALGADHADVAGALLEAWHFPALVPLAVHGLHHPDEVPAGAPGPLRPLLDVLAIASHVADLLSGEEPREALRAAEERARAAFGFDPSVLHELVLSIESTVAETSEMLAVRTPPGLRYADVLAEARGELLRRSIAASRALERAGREHRTRIAEDPGLRDADTGVVGAEGFRSFLEAEIDGRLAGTLDRPLGLLWIEVDRLPQAEVAFGRETRAELLRLVGATLVNGVRGIDLVAHTEPGRFAVVLSEATPFGLTTLAERLRASVEAAGLATAEGRVGTTITLGGACIGTVAGASDGAALLAAARRCLDRARALGHNRALVHGTLLGLRESA